MKFLLEDFVMIGHERPKFGHSCPTKPGVNLISFAVASRVLKH